MMIPGALWSEWRESVDLRASTSRSSEDSPDGLGPIDPWLAGKKSVTRLKSNYALFTTGSLKSGERIVVFQHSPKVRAQTKTRPI